MLLFFFCPASVYQQSFLGEQTTASTPTNAPEQHWYQREPIKLAIFEFDFFKNPVQGDNSQDEVDDAPDSRTNVKNNRSEVLSSIESNSIDLFYNKVQKN